MFYQLGLVLEGALLKCIYSVYILRGYDALQ